ncbi:DUF4115 domain-containing protein [Nocardiopsis sp. CNT-189]|uniref:DUF4115 domain-containing protein n=1 Tax=Nocardiopsis oceanisediminis TaxID=2816862 RepID=UPI003B348FD0
MAAIAAAIALFVALVALGGFFLYNSLPGNAAPAQPSEPAADGAEEVGDADDSVLYIKVVGDSSDVLVRIPGGEVLTDTTMTQGQYLSYDHDAMDVSVSEPDAVEVYVNGELKDLAGQEAGKSFLVEGGSPG